MFDDFRTPPGKHATWRCIFWGIMEEMHFGDSLHQFMEGGTVLRYLHSPSLRRLLTLQMPSTNSACYAVVSNYTDFSGRGTKR